MDIEKGKTVPLPSSLYGKLPVLWICSWCMALCPMMDRWMLLIEKRATELATQIVMRTANTMKLEDQANSKKRLEAAIKERATAIQNEMPKILWD
jgi:hypothetical protein